MWLTLWIAVQSVGRNRPRNRTILERRLQQQVSTVSSDWTWPGSTTLFLGAIDGTRDTIPSASELFVTAGDVYNRLDIDSGDTNWIFSGSYHLLPTAKLVPAGTTRQQCRSFFLLPAAPITICIYLRILRWFWKCRMPTLYFATVKF